MTHPETQYLDTLKEILENGTVVENRTSVNTKRTLGIMHKYDFAHGFPLFTTKKTWMKGITHELLWFLSGSTNIKYLVDNGVKIWNDDAYRYFDQKSKRSFAFLRTVPPTKEEFLEKVKSEELFQIDGYETYGDLGPVYGAQWRSWKKWHVFSLRPDAQSPVLQVDDQIKRLVNGLKNNPSSRRHILTAWNPSEIQEMALPPCHLMSQFTIDDGKLWCHMYQRSADFLLGVPFNVASYSLLTYLLAQVCDLEPGGFIHTIHDAHMYENHEEAVREQLSRTPKKFPKLELNPNIKDIDDFKYEDIKIVGYDSYPAIKAELVTG